MAQIELKILADNADDLRAALLDLVEGLDGGDAGSGEAVTSAPPKNRGGRPRRTAAPASGVTETPASTATADLTGSAAGQTTAPASASEDPLAAAIAAETGAAAAGPATKEQVVAALSSAIGAATPLAVKEKLEAAGLPYSVSKMTDTDFGKVLAVLQAIVAEAGAK